MLALSSLQQSVGRFVAEHATTILTVGGVAGTVTTGVLSFRAGWSARDTAEDIVHQDISAGPVTKKEIFLETWQVYIPPVLIGGVTIGSIVMANRVSASRAAALAAAYGIAQRDLDEYKGKVAEKLGLKKAEQVKDDIVQDHVSANPPGSSMIVVAEGDVLCYDEITGRYFQSSMEKLKRAELKALEEIVNHEMVSLGFFHDEVGLRTTSYTDSVGWNSNNKLELRTRVAMAENERPCIVVDFATSPTLTYNNSY